jgi:hypothetical protein
MRICIFYFVLDPWTVLKTWVCCVLFFMGFIRGDWEDLFVWLTKKTCVSIFVINFEGMKKTLMES